MDGTAEKQLANWLIPLADCTNIGINLHLYITSTQVMGGEGGAAGGSPENCTAGLGCHQQ